jgi:hypothetical protein
VDVVCISIMTRERVKDLLDKVLTWAPAEQEKVARFVREVEQGRAVDDITAEEWNVIEERAARRDLAADAEVEEVLGRFRRACGCASGVMHLSI